MKKLEVVPPLGNSSIIQNCVNLLIAAATKIEENEAELEILLDDARRGEGISGPSAVTITGATILCCFVLSCCLLLHLFVQEIRKLFEVRFDFESDRNFINRVSSV